MLHTLNKAWLEIMAKQLEKGIIEDCLCVCTDEEFPMIQEVVNKYKVNCKFFIVFTNELERAINICSFFRISPNENPSIMPIPVDRIYGDILISHEMHNPIIIDFLSRRRKRKY